MTKSISRSQVRLIASTNAIFGADEACAMLRISRDAMYRLAKDPDDPFLIRMPPYLAALKHEKQVAKSQVKGSKTAKKASVPALERRLDFRIYSPPSLAALP